MWEHKSGDAGPILSFFRSSLAGMWTRLFKLAKDKIPEEGKDHGFKVGYTATPISVQYTRSYSYPAKWDRP